jgi:hypothetical protein
LGLCEITAEVRVPTIATMQVALGAGMNNLFIGPFGPNDPDTDVIVTRLCVPVPHPYVQLALFRSLTPHDAWMQLGEAIIQDQRQVECGLVLDFLRAAAVMPLGPLLPAAGHRWNAPAAGQMAPLAGAAPAVPVDAAAVAPGGAAAPAQPAGVGNPVFVPPVTLCPPDMTPLLLDPPLTEHIRRTYLRYLPALGVPDAPAGITQQLLQSTLVLRDAIQGVAVGQQAPAAEAKSFSAAFPGMASSLRKLCGAGEVDDELPMFWRTFAAAGGKKNQCQPLLVALLNQRALEHDSTQIQQVVVNRFYEGLTQFGLGSADVDDLVLGLTPFLVCPAGYHKVGSQRSKSFLYTSVHGDGCMATLDDVRVLVDVDCRNKATHRKLGPGEAQEMEAFLTKHL